MTAAINRNGRPVNISALRATKEEENGRNTIQRIETAARLARAKIFSFGFLLRDIFRFHKFTDTAITVRRTQRPWADRVAGDVVFQYFLGDRPRHADKRVLSGDIVNAVSHSEIGTDRADIHDAAPSRPAHVRERMLYQMERSGDVDGEGAVPLIVRESFDRRPMAVNSVINEDVNRFHEP